MRCTVTKHTRNSNCATDGRLRQLVNVLKRGKGKEKGDFLVTDFDDGRGREEGAAWGPASF